MARLGDVVGSLLADVAAARVRVDWETVKLAEAYAAHDLLRHMPVPHFRLPEVRVDVPVVLEEPAGTHPGGYAKPGASELSGLVRKALARAGLRTSTAQRRGVYSAVQREVAEAFSIGPQVLLSSRRLSQRVADAASARLQDVFQQTGASTDQRHQIHTDIRRAMSGLLLCKLLQADGLQVRTASTAVREFSGSDSVMQVHLLISEDAMEMTTGEDDEPRLVPE